ncbi:MAG: hypothetical protein CL917_02150 [Deltaproteobacteria bacterium]|nr:hypothetical protein [Deltaproteobacteria bacterium]
MIFIARVTRTASLPKATLSDPFPWKESFQLAHSSLFYRVLAWAPALAWAALIWHLGSDSFSEPETRDSFGPWLRLWFPWLTEKGLENLVWGIRTLAHPAVYGLLTVLCWYAAAQSFSMGITSRNLLSLALCALLAVSDESRQGTSSVRSGAAGDVLLDLLGGIVGILGLGIFYSQRKKPPLKP